jgi:hypothetical protein
MTNGIVPCYIYKCGFKAGLTLSGFEDKAPQWIGKDKEWNEYVNLTKRYDEHK